MGPIILFVFLGFILPGLSVPLSPRTRVPEKSKAPNIHVYSLIPVDSCILMCTIQGFYPEDIDASWDKNGNVVPENDYVNTPAVKEKSGDSYFLDSKLTIPDSDWTDSSTFLCKVVYEPLETKVTQKSIKKTSRKP